MGYNNCISLHVTNLNLFKNFLQGPRPCCIIECITRCANLYHQIVAPTTKNAASKNHPKNILHCKKESTTLNVV